MKHMANPSSLVAVVLILLAGVDASTVVHVYRAIQYDISGVAFGSRVASLDHRAAFSLPAASGSDLSRTVVVLSSLDQLDEAFIQEYIEQPLGGLLVILPQAFGFPRNRSLLCDCYFTSEKKQLADLEQKLIHSTIQYPVYFALEDINILSVLYDIKRNNATASRYKVSVTSPAPKEIISDVIFHHENNVFITS